MIFNTVSITCLALLIEGYLNAFWIDAYRDFYKNSESTIVYISIKLTRFSHTERSLAWGNPTDLPRTKRQRLSISAWQISAYQTVPCRSVEYPCLQSKAHEEKFRVRNSHPVQKRYLRETVLRLSNKERSDVLTPFHYIVPRMNFPRRLQSAKCSKPACKAPMTF